MLSEIINMKNNIEINIKEKNKIIRKIILLKNYVKHVRVIIMEDLFILNPSDIQSIIFMIKDKYYCKNFNCVINVISKECLEIVLFNEYLKKDYTVTLSIMNDSIDYKYEKDDKIYRTDINSNLDIFSLNKNILNFNKFMKSVLNEIVVDYFFK